MRDSLPHAGHCHWGVPFETRSSTRWWPPYGHRSAVSAPSRDLPHGMAKGFERLSGVGEPLWALVLNTNSLTPHVGELGCVGLPTTAGSPLVHMGSLGPTMLREGSGCAGGWRCTMWR